MPLTRIAEQSNIVLKLDIVLWPTFAKVEFFESHLKKPELDANDCQQRKEEENDELIAMYT